MKHTSRIVMHAMLLLWFVRIRRDEHGDRVCTVEDTTTADGADTVLTVRTVEKASVRGARDIGSSDSRVLRRC